MPPGGLSVRYICNFQGSSEPIFLRLFFHRSLDTTRALHPIEAAYYHQPHLKGRQDYGHQILAVMLVCNGKIDLLPFGSRRGTGENNFPHAEY